MQKISERQGYIKVDTALQTEGINQTLRDSLWNVLDQHIWSDNDFLNKFRAGNTIYDPRIEYFTKDLWFNYFKRPVDTRPTGVPAKLKALRDYFFICEWYEVFDFIEYILGTKVNYHGLEKSIQKILERELSGYRLISNHFVTVTDEQEVDALKQILEDSEFTPVASHLQRALELLADRKNPDYRNSIKESISSVESMARIITGNSKATLGAALQTLESTTQIHPALKDGFSKLYGYTSDKGGIRHAMLDESKITAADAKFFLLSCTSFVNYLKSLI